MVFNFSSYPTNVTFLLSLIRESIVFGSNFRRGDFDGYTRFEVPAIRKYHF